MTDLPAEFTTQARPLVQMGHTFAAKLVIAASRALLLAAFARALDPADFGAYSLITTGLTFGIILLGLNANQFIYRSVPGRPEALLVLASVAAFETLLGLAILGLAVALGAFDAMLSFLHVEVYRTAFVIALGWILVELLCQDLLLFLYARQRIGEANILDLIKQVGWIPFALGTWALTGRLSVEIIVAASAGGAVTGALFGVWRIRPTVRPVKSIIEGALRFGLPLLIPALSFQALKLADRFFLSATRSLEETGVYALAASFANLLYSFSAVVIANTLTPIAVRASNEGDSARRDRMLWRTMTYSFIAFSAGALGLWVAGISVLARVARPEYAAALPFFPWLACGYGLIVIAAAPHNALYLANRTRTILAIDLAATALALALDFVLIPPYGGFGAAAATITGFGLGAAAKFQASGLHRRVHLADFLNDLAAIRHVMSVWRR